MDWTDTTRPWHLTVNHLLRRFPHADKELLAEHEGHPDDLARHLADTHHLTELEAREEMRDWIMIQALARDAMGAGTNDAYLLAAE